MFKYCLSCNFKKYILGFVFLILFLTLAFAEDAFLVRENTNFCWTSDNITLDDGVVTVWSDTKTSIWKLYAQKVDAAGNQLWNNGEPLLIYSSSNNYANYTDVIKTSDNGVIITWVKFFTPEDYRLYGQKISSSGQILWSLNNELLLQMTDYPHFHLAPNNIGGAYIIYDTYDSNDIYGINLDANANDIWNANPNPLLEDIYVEDVVSDNYNGFIVNYSYVTSLNILRAARFDVNANLVWNSTISTLDNNYYHSKMFSVGNDDFIIWFLNDHNVIGQRIDINGNTHWEDNGIIINSQSLYIYSNANLWGDENNFYMAYTVVAPPPSTDKIFKIQKYDLDANELWYNAVTLYDEDCYLVDMFTNSNQDCFVSWYYGATIYSQKINSAGNELWGDEGIIISSNIQFEWTQGGLQICELNDQPLVMWQAMCQDSSFLRYQILDSNGNFQLPAEGSNLQSGLYSYIGNYQLTGNDDSSYMVWEDNRFQGRIFVQRMMPDGTCCFPENGITITNTAAHPQEMYRSIALPEGGIAVVWNEVLENETYKRVRWQIINPAGYMLSPSGFNITADVSEDQTNPDIDVVDGNLIITWLDNDQIKAQKLVNYAPVWGENGKILIENGNTEYCRLAGHYIHFDYMDSYYFTKMDDDGNIAVGWPYNAISTNATPSYLEDMYEYNGDLVYTWHNYFPGYNIFGFQILNSYGTYNFSDDGFIICDDEDYYYHNFLFDGCIYLVHEEDMGLNFILEKYDLQGNAIWTDVTIENTNYFNRLKSIKLGDNILVSWYEDFDTYSGSYMMKMVDADGNVLTSNLTYDDFPVLSDRRDYQLVSVTDTDAAILFKRGYDVGSETTFFFSGLVSYQVNISDVPIEEDEIVNTSNFQLSNYPNPFNPTTMISFDLTTTELTENTVISIYNLKGQKVKSIDCHPELVEGYGASHSYSIVWNGTNQNDKPVSSGIYFYQLKVDGKTKASRKCLLLK